MGFDWKSTLSKIAPLAGTMLAGPWGGMAGKAIGDIFGHQGDTPPSESEMAGYIDKATPEQLVALKGLDANLRIRMRELDIKEDELVYEDKDSARKMQIANRSSVPAILVLVLTLGVFAMFGALMYFTVPEANKAIVYMIAGSVLTGWVGSVQFFVGTTKSSQEKTQLMANK